MTKPLALLFVLPFILLAPGCFNSAEDPGSQAISTLDRVQNTGVLRVGYFLFEPTVMHDKSGKPYGLFIDMVEEVAKALRWTVEYKQVDLKNFAAGLQAHDFDLSIGATFASPTRGLGVAFTKPIFYMGYTGVTSSQDIGRYKTWHDLDKRGVRIAVKQGSAIGDHVRREFKNATIISLEEQALSAPLAAVPAQADVGLMNQITVFAFLRDNPSAKLAEIFPDAPIEFTGICWAARQGDERFLQFINTSLQYLEDTGRIREWEKKYSIPYLYHVGREFEYDSGQRRGRLQTIK